MYKLENNLYGIRSGANNAYDFKYNALMKEKGVNIVRRLESERILFISFTQEEFASYLK